MFKFIKKYFDKMPDWVQIPTYILFVLGFFGLLFSPKYIDIRLVGNFGDGDFPIGEARVEIETEDRVITMVTDSKGRFSVPIGLANPLGNYIFVLYPDSQTRRQIDVNVSGYKAFINWNKLTYSREKDKYEFSSLLNFPFITSAYAQGDIIEFRAMDKVDDVVLEAISKTTGIKSTEINLQANLSDDLSLSNYDLSYINYRLNKDFGIEAWDEIWDNAKTAEDIIGIARALYYQDKPWGEHLVSRNKNISILLSEAKDKYPQVLYNKFLTARALRKSGNNKASIELLNQVISQQPDFYLAKYNQALAYDSLSNFELAKSAYNDAIELQRKEGFSDASIYNTYGRFLYRNERYKESLRAYIKVREINPDRSYSAEYIDDSLKKLGCSTVEQCITKP